MSNGIWDAIVYPPPGNSGSKEPPPANSPTTPLICWLPSPQGPAAVVMPAAAGWFEGPGSSCGGRGASIWLAARLRGTCPTEPCAGAPGGSVGARGGSGEAAGAWAGGLGGGRPPSYENSEPSIAAQRHTHSARKVGEGVGHTEKLSTRLVSVRGSLDVQSQKPSSAPRLATHSFKRASCAPPPSPTDGHTPCSFVAGTTRIVPSSWPNSIDRRYRRRRSHWPCHSQLPTPSEARPRPRFG